MSDDELKKELRELVAVTGRLAENHKTVLQRHEKDILCAFKTCKNHHAAIETLRNDLISLGDLVNKQTEILNCLRESTLKILNVLGMPSPAPPPAQPN